MIKIGLTGSIGMGKSTTARLFAEFGGAIHDADAAVAELYAEGGAGAAAIGELAPQALRGGAVDRAKLREAVLATPGLLQKIETAIHPLVAAERETFLGRSEAEGRRFVVFDIPLLFETGSEAFCDVVVVVSTDPATQRERVLARPVMTEEALEKILSRQTPDTEKRSRADYVIDTSDSVEDARRQVEAVLKRLEERFDVDLLGA